MKNMIAKNPIEFQIEEGSVYAFCTCGHSAKHPLCDGSHKEKAPECKSHKMIAEETKSVWICQCSASDNSPFCDGKHKEL